MQRLSARTLTVLAALAALSTTAAADSVDLQLRGNDKVSGTIRPAYDQETFFCDLAQGTTLIASVKGKGKNGPVFHLALQQNSVDVPGTTFVVKGTGMSLKPFHVPSSGQYRLVVTGDGVKDGDYDFAASWKAPTSQKGASAEPVPQAEIDTFTFSAPAGATATVDVLKKGGAPFKADLVEVFGPDDYYEDLSDTGGAHAVLAALPSTGEYSVSFENVGGDGDWSAKVKLKLPKFKAGKFDIRDGKLGGAFAGEHVVYGRVVGEDGGTLIVQSDFGSPLDGTSVVIPAGSLGGPVVVTVSAAPAISGAGGHDAGPAVDFGPSGTVFDPNKAPTDHSKQAQLTIPFNPAAFAGGDTSSLVVYVKHANGVIEAVPGPYEFTASSVTFYTSGFSTYQATTTNPRAFAGNFVAIELNNNLSFNFGGSIGFGLHDMYSDGTTALASFFESTVDYQNYAAAGAFANLSSFGSSANLDVQVLSDTAVSLTDPGASETIVLQRGASDDVFVARKKALVILRRPAGYPTTGSIAGTWHLFEEEFEASPSGDPPVLAMQFKGQTADVTFGADGNVTIGPSRNTKSESSYPNGQWSSGTETKPAMSDATWGAVENLVRVTPSSDPSFDLYPVLDGNMLVGLQSSPDDGSPPRTSLTILVRASTNTPKSAFAEAFPFTSSRIDVVDNDVTQEPPLAQDFTFQVGDLVATLASNGTASVAGTHDEQAHDDQGLPITALEVPEPAGQSTQFSYHADGSFSSTKGEVGALTIGGGLLVYTGFRDGRYEFAFGVRGAPPLVLVREGPGAK